MQKILKDVQAALKTLTSVEAALMKQLEAPVVADAADEVETAARIIYWDENDVDNNTNLDELGLKELKALAKEAEIALTAKDAEGMRQEIYNAYYPSEEAEEAPADEEPEEEAAEEEVSHVVVVMDADDNEVEVDLDAMDVKALKEFAKTYGVTLSSKTKPDIISEILSAFYPEEDGEVDEEAAEEAEEAEEEQSPADYYGLTDMSTEDLANLLTSYGLSPKGKKEALIDRALKAIEDGTIPVEQPEGE